MRKSETRWLARLVGIVVATAALNAGAEVVRVEVTRTDDFGTHDRIVGRVHYAVDPALAANGAIADLHFAPRNSRGQVEFVGDVLFFRPKDGTATRGTVFLGVVNRGGVQPLSATSNASGADRAPQGWDLGDGFLLKNGFAAAFLGWQFDLKPEDNLRLEVPVAPVEGVVRRSYVERKPGRTVGSFPLDYCVTPRHARLARLTFRTRIDAPSKVLPRNEWSLEDGGCTVRFPAGFERGIYEAIYRAEGSPVAGLGLAAVRDFASYLRYGDAHAPLRERPAALERIIGFGYSQSARFLREFVRDGFNADEQGRPVFDGLMIGGAGAGVGSFNHRFATPGMAGNSVLHLFRPVDVPPFTDDGLLKRARAADSLPRIFYVFSSTEYWARGGSLTHTSFDGRRDVPLAETSRLYLLAGTPHSRSALPLTKKARGGGEFRFNGNFATSLWAFRGLLLALDDWAARGVAPPPSAYPTIARGELVRLEALRFPCVQSFTLPDYLPGIWQLDWGRRFRTRRVITIEPPKLGPRYTVLVPQVDASGNDFAGIRLPEIEVPLGTYTGWNIELPQSPELQYLGGLNGSFVPFPLTREDRLQSGDCRSSIAERYASRDDYLQRVRQSAEKLVAARFVVGTDVGLIVQKAAEAWDAIVGKQAP